MSSNQTIHATCVSWNNQAVLITGASGRGKSALGLILIGLGCDLVADDRVLLRRTENGLMANSPDSINGLIEARGIGILNAATVTDAKVVLAVDLDQVETQRLPKRRSVTHLGIDIALIRAIDGPHFAASILQILRAGWSTR